ncbi:MAG: TerB family tellurite resistance protein [Trueperaceae bacterium]|nr:TerB family tellurite resistance protein [Trueperaceae bacterium]
MSDFNHQENTAFLLEQPELIPAGQRDEAILAICLMAALADGQKDDQERTKLKSIFDTFQAADASNIYKKVLLKETTLPKETSRLTSAEEKMLAFEMATSICEADGRLNPAEQSFIQQLGQLLGVSKTEADAFIHQADTLVSSPQALEAMVADPLGQMQVPAQDLRHEQAALTRTSDQSETNITQYAVIAGALELLPQSLATMAVLPLQLKMVHDIARDYGYQLDQSHAKELLATLGVGMGSQVLEGFVRKFLGGAAKELLGKKVGKTVKKVTQASTGPVMSFATTYAIGVVAKNHYANGRQLNTQELRNQFGHELERGKTLYASHSESILKRSKTLDLGQLMSSFGQRPVT